MTRGGGQLALDRLPGLGHGGHHGGVGAVLTVDGLVRPVLGGGGAVQGVGRQQLKGGNLEEDRVEEKTRRTEFPNDNYKFIFHTLPWPQVGIFDETFPNKVLLTLIFN